MANENIDGAQIEHIAKLARLQLGETEAKSLQHDLDRILDYVSKLAQLDTSEVPATTHAVELSTQTRPDERRPGLPLDRGLADAPERIGDGFGVPKVIE